LFCGVEQDVEEAAFVVVGVVGEVSFDVLDGLGQDVETVSQLVELLAGDDQLVLAETELTGPAAGFVVALATGAFAVLAGPAGTGRRSEPAPAPSAPRCHFC
jgi:hypothetical protein